MIDLYAKLSDKDKKLINNYILEYGGIKDSFIGSEKWLQYWNHSKQKLYKLLGNNFIYSQDFHYIKNGKELDNDLKNFVNNHSFGLRWKCFISYLQDINIISSKEYYSFLSFTYPITLFNGKYNDTLIKIKKNESAKELRIQSGTRVMRAVFQTLKYFKEEVKDFEKECNSNSNADPDKPVDVFKEFEDFRVKHSILVNDKEIKGRIHISIHPLDYMTMSHNDSNWTSCMSWKNGCYRAGTIEMMNSNNVLCCYITSNKNKTFDFSKDKDKKWEWSNKSWRQLVYITKDIIVGGKSYPFDNPDLTKEVLKIVNKLAKKNLNWTYQYGIEQYNDMKYIHSEYAMARARGYMKNDPRKRNILFETNGMYNDMIADHCRVFWCYRNKVKKTKIITYSGKTCCLSCGEPIIEYDEDRDETYYDYDEMPGYNDRYLNVGSCLCEECKIA